MSVPSKLRDNAINFCLVAKPVSGDRGSGKSPFQNGWQNKELKWDNEELTNWIKQGGNYGVVGGGEKNLIVLDFDDETIQNEIIDKLPETFTVKTGGGLLHKYFFCDEGKGFRVKSKDNDTLVDVQGKSTQVVAPGSVHYSGNTYSIEVNSSIADITMEKIHELLDQYNQGRTAKKSAPITKPMAKSYTNTNDFQNDLFNSVTFESLLSEFGVDTSQQQTNCPFHESKGMKCLGWTEEVAHCFNCDDKWNKMSWLKDNLNVDAKGAIEWLAEREGKEEELEDSRREWRTEKREEEKKEEKLGAIIWDKDLESWQEARMKSVEKFTKENKLKFYAHSKETIKGKPQLLINDKKTNLNLIKVFAPKDEKEGGNTFAFLGEKVDGRSAGNLIGKLNENFWTYTLIDDYIEYLVMTKEKLDSSEIHTFHGMNIKSDNSKEVLTEFKLNGMVELFVCNEFVPTIQAMPKEEIIPAVKSFMEKQKMDSKEFRDFFFDYIFTHEDGNIYRQPEDYMMVRHAQLLSGKVSGYPLSTFSIGVPGCSKTMEIECLDRIFEEGILEAGNSTPKALIPSFKEKPANPGYILSQNRMALIDELTKMIDNQIIMNGANGVIKNQLAQLNYLFEHKKRNVSSGNNNSIVETATAKTVMVGNPAGRMRYLSEHIKVLDESTMSRLFIWIKGFDHKKFVQSNKVVKSRDTHQTICNTDTVYIHNSMFRDFYLSIYDSCQKFVCEISSKKVEELFNQTLALVPEELQNVWGARGKHHTELIIDGIVKFKRIFGQQKDNFVAEEEDYDYAERILVQMAQSWSEGLR